MEKVYARTKGIRDDMVVGFCPGCMHGTVFKLIGEVLEELGVLEKTITVQVSTYMADPIYKKRVAYFKKYKAHDEKQEAKVGDTVLIEETRHISKDKYFRLIKVVKRGEE